MDDYNEVVLDLTGCCYLGEIHRRIQKTFGFPAYYGENWDAFLDAFRTVGVPDKIIILGEHSIPEELQPQLGRMHAVLDRMREELKKFDQTFSYEIVQEISTEHNRRYELDFTECGSVGELYGVIVREMELPAWFGNNLSAFWDALTGMIETPASLAFHRQTKNPGLAAYAEKRIAVARRAEKEEGLGITVIER